MARQPANAIGGVGRFYVVVQELLQSAGVAVQKKHRTLNLDGVRRGAPEGGLRPEVRVLGGDGEVRDEELAAFGENH